MKDPNEEPKKEQSPIDPVEQKSEEDNGNYGENQRIDEEGNELDPEDIK